MKERRRIAGFLFFRAAGHPFPGREIMQARCRRERGLSVPGRIGRPVGTRAWSGGDDAGGFSQPAASGHFFLRWLAGFVKRAPLRV